MIGLSIGFLIKVFVFRRIIFVECKLVIISNNNRLRIIFLLFVLYKFISEIILINVWIEISFFLLRLFLLSFNWFIKVFVFFVFGVLFIEFMYKYFWENFNGCLVKL